MISELENADINLSVLNTVCKHLQPPHLPDEAVVQNVRQALKTFIIDKPTNVYGKIDHEMSIRWLARTISSLFDHEYEAGFTNFKLTISASSLARFIELQTKPKIDTICLITAFLLHPEIAYLHEQDIHSGYLGYNAAYDFISFFNSSMDCHELNHSEFSGVYTGIKVTSKRDEVTTSLKMTPSSDNTHILIEEHVIVIPNSSCFKKHYPLIYRGWGALTDLGVLHIYLKNDVNSCVHSYQSFFYRRNSQTPNGHVTSLNLLRFHKNINTKQLNSEEVIELHVEDNHFTMERDSNMLTFPLRINDTTVGVGTEENPFGKTTRSALPKERTITMTMTEDEKNELGRQMLEAWEDHKPSDVADLLKQGANINYQSETTGHTLIHFIAHTGVVELYEEVLELAHDEYNPLIRAKNGELPSQIAISPANKEGELFITLRTKEVEAGEAKGIYPSNAHPSLDRPFGEVEDPYDFQKEEPKSQPKLYAVPKPYTPEM